MSETIGTAFTIALLALTLAVAVAGLVIDVARHGGIQ